MSRVNIVKKIRVDSIWKLLSLPRNTKGSYDWNGLPQGLYLIEWYAGGKRRRESAGITATQALDPQRRKNWRAEDSACPVSSRLAKRPRIRPCTSP